MLSGTIPDCKSCGFIKVIPENFEVMHLIERYINFMIDGFSGLPDILKILKILEINDLSDRKDLLEKILYYTQILVVSKQSKREN